AAFVLTIAAQGKIRLMRQRGKHVKLAASIGNAHLPPELAREHGPCPVVLSVQRFAYQPRAWRQIRKPYIVIIELRKVALRNAARRAPNGSEPQALAGFAGRPEPDD